MDSTGSGSEQIERIKELLREKEPKLEELLDEALRMEKSNQEKKDQKQPLLLTCQMTRPKNLSCQEKVEA